MQSIKSAKDGLRVCVMRRIKPGYDFDIWIPGLAPSESLLKKYVIDKSMSWPGFSRLYMRQMASQKHLIRMLVYLSVSTKITLLCWEKSAKFCHRSLLLAECKNLSEKINP